MPGRGQAVNTRADDDVLAVRADHATTLPRNQKIK
jgi:hypothetical protein